MTTIDELAYRAEVEAEVLRAVGKMTSTDACEFLLDVVLKIRRASNGSFVDVKQSKTLALESAQSDDVSKPADDVSKPADDVSKPVENPTGGEAAAVPLQRQARGKRIQVIIGFMKKELAATSSEIRAHVSAVLREMPGGISNNRTTTAIWGLVQKGILIREEGGLIRITNAGLVVEPPTPMPAALLENIL